MSTSASLGQHRHHVRLAATWHEVHHISDPNSKLLWVDTFATHNATLTEPPTGLARHITESLADDPQWIEFTATTAHRFHTVGLQGARAAGQHIAQLRLAAEHDATINDQTNFVLVAGIEPATGAHYNPANMVTAGAIIDAMYRTGYRRASAESRLAVAGYRAMQLSLVRFLNDTDSGRHFVQNKGQAALQQLVTDSDLLA